MIAALGLPPRTASAQPTASTYWLARTTGTDYVYDVPLPPDLAAMLSCTQDPAAAANSGKYSRFAFLCANTPAPSGGGTVTRTTVTWDKDLIDGGQLLYSNPAKYEPSLWQTLKTGGVEWKQATDEIKKQAKTTGTWKTADLQVFGTTDASAAPLRVPIPDLVLAQNEMTRLAARTARGQFFEVDIPADIQAYRAQMLAYGNAGRRDPNFRADNGKPQPFDLSADTVTTKTGSIEQVYKQNPTPPYFAEHQSSDTLNRAAQFQAEYLASQDTGPSHDGPATWTDPTTGRSVSMKSLNDRGAFFGTPPAVEAAAGGGPGTAPRTWMIGTTHFRPWFNVDGTYPRIGYGIARATTGNWYQVAVPEWSKNRATPTIDSAGFPLSNTVGATTPGALTAVIDSSPIPGGSAPGGVSADPPPAKGSGGVATDTAAATPSTTSRPADPAADPTPAADATALPRTTLDKACEGFAAYLRQEVGSKQATVSAVDPGGLCDISSPDLQGAQLQMSPITADNGRADTCEDVARGRTTDAETISVQALGAEKRAVTSSGSAEQGFPFVMGWDGNYTTPRAISCDSTYQYWARLDRAEGVNPLLAVNAAAEAMRAAVR